jgi:hypothetical protein
MLTLPCLELLLRAASHLGANVRGDLSISASPHDHITFWRAESEAGLDNVSGGHIQTVPFYLSVRTLCDPRT